MSAYPVSWKAFRADRTLLAWFHLSLALAAGAAISRIGSVAGQTVEPTAKAFITLLFLSCASYPLKIHLPGIDQPFSLSLVFRFTVATELPPLYALVAVVLTTVYEHVTDKERRVWRRDLVFDLASGVLCTVCTSLVHEYLEQVLHLQPVLTRGTAALCYFVLATGTSSMQIGIQTARSPWQVWRDQFFWTAPLYALATVPGEITRLLREASPVPDQLLGVGLTLIGYRYAKVYFARLHDQQDHARRLDQIRDRTIEALVVAIENKDGCTGDHIRRVKHYSTALAHKLGFPQEAVRTLELAAILHDVGKVAVPDYILRKAGRLTEYEFSQMAVHTSVGHEIVSAIQFPYPVAEIVLSHHEHWDGSGYPRQLVGAQIPPLARILTIADCFDALVSDRPYRPALPIAKALEIMRQQRGKIFDPALLDVFFEEIPALTKDLEAELERDRARNRLSRPPLPRIRQTWLNDSEVHEELVRRRSLEKLASSPDQLVLLYEVLQVLGSGLEAEESLKKVLGLLQRFLPHHRAGIFLLEQDRFLLLQGVGFPDHCISRLTIPAAHGVIAHAVSSRQSIAAEGPPTELPQGVVPKYFEDVQSSLVGPLVSDERVVGAIVLCADSPGQFHPEHAWFLDMITGKIASTVSTALSLQSLRLDAATDPMTKLPNSRTTFDRLRAEINRADRLRAPLAVFFLDLNDFKPVNDSHGHGAGDRLLLGTAECLKSCLRPYDLLGRVGGDEFVVIMAGIPPESVPSKIEALKEAVANNRVALGDGTEVGTTISIGAACYPCDARDAEELIFLSDQRMYRDKKQAKGRAAEATSESPEGRTRGAQADLAISLCAAEAAGGGR